MKIKRDEEIVEILDHFNDMQDEVGSDLFAVLKEYDMTAEQIFIAIEEHQETESFNSLEKILKEKISKRIVLCFIKNNHLFDTLL